MLANDCEVNFVKFTPEIVAAGNKPEVEKVIFRGNPCMTGCFVDENHFIGAGFDNAPLLFTYTGGKWSFTKSLDPGLSKKKAAKIQKDAFGVTSVFFDAQKLDDNIVSYAKDTKHQNYINYC